MIDLYKTLDALRDRDTDIVREHEELNANDMDLSPAIEELEGMSKSDFVDKFGGSEPARPAEFGTPLVNQVNQFASLDEAVAWSVDQLQGVTLGAVDGSQINPTKELSHPIAMVQSGYFLITLGDQTETEHDLFPRPLLAKDALTSDGMAIREGDVSLARQQLEIETGMELLDILQDYDQPLILLDGTLIYSYMNKFDQTIRQDAIDDLVRFLRRSERLKIPVVGYIDTSFAKDLFNLLSGITGHDIKRSLTDVSILRDELTELGQYTIPFYCRRDPIPEYGPYASKICFAYARINSVRNVRLEFPSWIYEEGVYDEVVSRIVAECLISHGYPRVLTRAHETAVLTNGDRRKFNNLVINYFSNDLDIDIKELSKANMKQKFY